ncbi:hypothetical protein [Aliiglaciecola lipolytica]|uniref:Uncharacterized protein n=1 Tax=Aliiglaciecola lipolytica E3 TaxID=1127673 RepID=K6XTQ6_9ALTE|nr:hypothetical protein [Aliiglaciecola lipolytica]GAC15066.1 hypothetical protein GLIP_2440 [Aliiglaciecola lipolytica E3]
MKFSLTLKRLANIAGITAFALHSVNAYAQDNATVQMTSQTCPTEFYALPLFPKAKMCQIFAPELPASLTYHASTDQQSTQQFYTEKLGQAEQVKALKGRILMEYDGANKIIIISKDGAGTQVDVLVKS